MKKNIKTSLHAIITMVLFTAIPAVSFAETVTWTDRFVYGEIPSDEQCQAWHDFLDQLEPGKGFVSVKLSGTYASEDITMTDSDDIWALAHMLYNREPGSVFSNGHTWTVGIGCNRDSCVPALKGVELVIDEPACQCRFSDTYSIRPDIGMYNWGGINTESCSSPDQEMTVEFQTNSDSDGDGVDDDMDMCPDSDLSLTIMIDGCDSGVDNTLFSTGCSVNDQVAECAANATNHGSFVSCVSDTINLLKKEGLVSGKEKGAVQKCAAKANIL